MNKAIQGIVRSVFYSTCFILVVTIPQLAAMSIGAPIEY